MFWRCWEYCGGMLRDSMRFGEYVDIFLDVFDVLGILCYYVGGFYMYFGSALEIVYICFK